MKFVSIVTMSTNVIAVVIEYHEMMFRIVVDCTNEPLYIAQYIDEDGMIHELSDDYGEFDDTYAAIESFVSKQ